MDMVSGFFMLALLSGTGRRVAFGLVDFGFFFPFRT
jgi:hypothetical protein